MSHFNQANIERKNCVWTTKNERLLEMCKVQHVELKSVFTFQRRKRLVSTTVKSAKPAATFSKFLWSTKNRQLCCLAVTVHIALQERRVATTKKRNHLHFWRNFPANHNQAHRKLNQKRLKWVQIWNKRIRFLLADVLSDIFFFKSFCSISIYSQPLRYIQPTFRKSWSSQSPSGIQWTLNFGPESVTIAVNDLVQMISISS